MSEPFSKLKASLIFLSMAPAILLGTGCDQVIKGISGEPPPCVISQGAECEPVPPPQPPIGI